MIKKHLNIVALVASAIIVVIDQILKYLAVINLKDVITVPLIENVLHLTYIENRGAAFSMLEGNRWLLTFFTSALLLVGAYILVSKKLTHPFAVWTIAAVMGGGAGNLIDRIFRGYVVDYIDVRLINFAVFNFADCCIVIGTILFAVYILFIHKDKPLSTNDETMVDFDTEIEGKDER